MGSKFHSVNTGLPGMVPRFPQTQPEGEIVFLGLPNEDPNEDVVFEVAKLRSQIMELQTCLQNAAFSTLMYSLGTPLLELKKPIPVTIRPDGDEYIASFFDANISTGGGTPPEAIDNLQSLIADFFTNLESVSDDKLGPSMKKQKLVLMESVCRTS